MQLLDNLVRDLNQLNDDLFFGLLHVVEVSAVIDDEAVDDELVFLLVDVEGVYHAGGAGQQVVVHFQLLVLDELDPAPVELARVRIQFWQRLDE